MVLIILFSFGSFLVVQNRALKFDTPTKDHDTYIPVYFGNEMIDSLVSVYMVGALGNFTTDNYKVGPATYFVMFMFLLSTFVVSVVFMNMVIAIMGDTFGQVLEGAEQNGIQEQLFLISDHLWLLDLQKIFQGQRYVVILTPSSSSSEEKDRAIDEIKNMKRIISGKFTNLDNMIQT